MQNIRIQLKFLINGESFWIVGSLFITDILYKSISVIYKAIMILLVYKYCHKVKVISDITFLELVRLSYIWMSMNRIDKHISLYSLLYLLLSVCQYKLFKFKTFYFYFSFIFFLINCLNFY